MTRMFPPRRLDPQLGPIVDDRLLSSLFAARRGRARYTVYGKTSPANVCMFRAGSDAEARRLPRRFTASCPSHAIMPSFVPSAVSLARSTSVTGAVSSAAACTRKGRVPGGTPPRPAIEAV